MLVDEATSCVDGETDALIQDALRTQFHNCTMLVVAHRLQTIMDADLIVVLDAGCVVETGAEPDRLNFRTSLSFRYVHQQATAISKAVWVFPFCCEMMWHLNQ